MTKRDRGEKAFRNEQRKARCFDPPKTKRSALTYSAAVASFAETEDCSPVEAVAAHRRCRQIARQFNKTPQQVATDINRLYIASYSHP
jgi:hypothetical protein